MERHSFSVVFFCKKTKVTRKGKAPIYARIKTDGQAVEIYTQARSSRNIGINGSNARYPKTR